MGPGDGALAALIRGELLDVAARLEAPEGEGVPPIEFALHVAELVAEARRAGLDFVADALPATIDGALDATLVPSLVAEGLSRVEAEEAIDLLSCRGSRASLLCRAGRVVLAQPDFTPLTAAGSFSAVLRREGELELGPEHGPEHPMTFAALSGASITTDDPPLKAALLTLGERWPGGLTAEVLAAEAHDKLARMGLALAGGLSLEAKDALVADLCEIVARQQIELLPWAPAIPDELDYRPRLSAVTRLELGVGESVSSARHTALVLEPLLRTVALLLDGARSLDACVDAVTAELDAVKLTLGELPTEAEARKSAVRWRVLDAMSRLRRLGLLEPPVPDSEGEAIGDDGAGS